MIRYEVGSIALDATGTYWVTYVGDRPEQGGLTFGKSTIGFKSADAALTWLGHTITAHEEIYKKLIAEKEPKND